MKNILLKFNFVSFSLLALFLFTACGSSNKVSKKEKVAVAKTEKIKQKELKEAKTPMEKINKIMVYLGDDSVVKWKLITINDQQASGLYENLPMMRFDEPWKQVYGTTGCNKFTAYYEKSSNTIAISRVSATGLPCDNTNEPLFLDSLKEVDEIREENNSLTLLSQGQTLLIFERF